MTFFWLAYLGLQKFLVRLSSQLLRRRPPIIGNRRKYPNVSFTPQLFLKDLFLFLYLKYFAPTKSGGKCPLPQSDIPAYLSHDASIPT